MADNKKDEVNPAQVLMGCMFLIIFGLSILGLGMSIVWRIAHW